MTEGGFQTVRLTHRRKTRKQFEPRGAPAPSHQKNLLVRRPDHSQSSNIAMLAVLGMRGHT